MKVASNTTYEAERFDGPSEKYPDVGGEKFGDEWLIAIAGTIRYVQAGTWILAPCNEPEKRIICSDEYFNANYSETPA